MRHPEIINTAELADQEIENDQRETETPPIEGEDPQPSKDREAIAQLNPPKEPSFANGNLENMGTTPRNHGIDLVKSRDLSLENAETLTKITAEINTEITHIGGAPLENYACAVMSQIEFQERSGYSEPDDDPGEDSKPSSRALTFCALAEITGCDILFKPNSGALNATARSPGLFENTVSTDDRDLDLNQVLGESCIPEASKLLVPAGAMGDGNVR